MVFFLYIFVQKVIITNFSHKKVQVRIRIGFGFSLDPRHYYDDIGKRIASCTIYAYARTDWQKMNETHLILICLRVHTIFFLQNGSLPELCCSLSQLKEMKKNFALPKNLLDRG